jgi:septum formation topological specificity factor MinE
MIPFKLSSTERLQYVIFESRNMNQESNIAKMNEVKDDLIQSIGKTLKERNEEAKKYEDSKFKYYHLRKKLADRLLTVTYSTKLESKRGDPSKKCSLT